MIARLFNTVGPRQSGQYGMVIPRFVQNALAGQPIEMHGDGTQTRCVLPRPGHGPRAQGLMDERASSGEIFNVGSSERISDPGARRAGHATLTGSDSEIVYIPYDKVYGQGIEDTLHRSPRSRRSATRSAGGPSATSTRSSPT